MRSESRPLRCPTHSWSCCAQILLLILLLPCTALAQATEAIAPARPWQVSLSIAGVIRSPLDGDRERFMERAGLGDDLVPFPGVPTIFFPRSLSNSSSQPIAGTIARSITDRLQIAVAVGYADLGSTEGWRYGGTGFSQDDWFLNLGADAISAAVLVRGGGSFHLGVGPSVHRIEDWWEGGAQGRVSRHTTRLGLATEAGGSWPTHSTLFADASLRHYWIGSLRRGPFELFSDQGPITVAEASIPLRHWVVAFGLGVRL